MKIEVQNPQDTFSTKRLKTLGVRKMCTCAGVLSGLLSPHAYGNSSEILGSFSAFLATFLTNSLQFLKNKIFLFLTKKDLFLIEKNINSPGRIYLFEALDRRPVVLRPKDFRPIFLRLRRWTPLHCPVSLTVQFCSSLNILQFYKIS